MKGGGGTGRSGRENRTMREIADDTEDATTHRPFPVQARPPPITRMKNMYLQR